MSEGTFRGGGWGREAPGIQRHEIVELLLGLSGDPEDPSTWRYRNRPLTEAERVILFGSGPTERADAVALMDLDLDHRRRRLHYLRSEGFDVPDDPDDS